MTHFMSYVVLLAAAIGACGVVFDATFGRRLPRRWIWLACLGATLAATGLAMMWPASASDSVVTPSLASSTLILGEPTASSLPVTTVEAAFDAFATVDAILPFAWLLSSACLLLMIVLGHWRLRRERSRARPMTLAGHPVLVSESIGPAVAGVRSPVVFIPNWVLALDEPSRRLLMAHEMEHVRRRDTIVLFAGALGAALVPWNPVVWWIVRRLRLAVEQDCDSRVLAVNPGVRRYADLLLLAASRHGLTTRLLAAHFGEHSSDLVRRIDTMTRQHAVSWRHVVSATAIASLLLAAACEAPRPAPVAPLAGRNESAEERTADMEMEKSRSESDKFSVVVLSSDGKQLARYAGEIPVAHLPHDGVQSVTADEFNCADSKCYTVRITLKPGYTLNLEEIEASRLPSRSAESTLREFTIPEIEVLRDVSERIKMMNAKVTALDEKLPGAVEVNGEAIVDQGENVSRVIRAGNELLAPDKSTQGARKRVLYHLHDPNAIGPLPPNVIVYNSDGSEHARFPSPGRALASIEVHGVESIKEQKTGDCSPLGCPIARITLKPGFKLISYQEWKGRPQ